LAGTRWATERRHHRSGRLPSIDLDLHARVCRFATEQVAGQVGRRPGDDAGGRPRVHAVHDVSGGGLAVALAEMAAVAGAGCTLSFADPAELFTEMPSRVLMATPDPDRLCAAAAAAGVPAVVLGPAGGGRFVLGDLVDLAVEALAEAYEGALPRALGEE
jgi:phosphoribosylformylglycinamidine synthase